MHMWLVMPSNLGSHFIVTFYIMTLNDVETVRYHLLRRVIIFCHIYYNLPKTCLNVKIKRFLEKPWISSLEVKICRISSKMGNLYTLCRRKGNTNTLIYLFNLWWWNQSHMSLPIAQFIKASLSTRHWHLLVFWMSLKLFCSLLSFVLFFLLYLVCIARVIFSVRFYELLNIILKFSRKATFKLKFKKNINIQGKRTGHWLNYQVYWRCYNLCRMFFCGVSSHRKAAYTMYMIQWHNVSLWTIIFEESLLNDIVPA